MHRIFRKALDTATGNVHTIIAVIIDIRDFSPFSLDRDSVEIALFLKRVYINIIDSYFDFASFYKSTGDGLLLTIRLDKNDIAEVTQKTIANCLACHRGFGNICSSDRLINFTVPNKIGIGVARGAACCLTSGRRIIDYSGRLINLTSRLTALARPSGIVIDQSLGIDLLDERTRNNFKEQDVYLYGIAESTPIKVYFTDKFTRIPERNKRTITEETWQHTTDVKPFSDIAKSGRFLYVLKSKPISDESIEVKIFHPKITRGKIHEGYNTMFYFKDFKYRLITGKPVVSLNFEKLRKELEKNKVKKDMKVYIDIAYIKG